MGTSKNDFKIFKKTSYELGFAAFYLNRTNRSGILNAGVIGGKKQDGKWEMDARFNRDNLASRILKTIILKLNQFIKNTKLNRLK